jgi:hypothetical protein
MNITVSNETLTYSFSSELSFQAILDAFVNVSKRKGYVAPQKVYRVVDNSSHVMTTMDELKALRRYRDAIESHEEANTWAWVDIEDLE